MFGPTPPHLLGVPGVGGGGPGGHLGHHPFSPFGGGGGFDQTKVNRSKRKKMSAIIDTWKIETRLDRSSRLALFSVQSGRSNSAVSKGPYSSENNPTTL